MTEHIKKLIADGDVMAMHYRIESLKKAAIVMGQLADSFKDKSVRDETRSLAWSISWAVIELTEIMNQIAKGDGDD